MFDLEIKFDADHLVRVLIAAELSVKDSHDILQSVGLSLLEKNKARHESEQDPSGKKWTPLKPATIKRKTNPRMLFEEGDLLADTAIYSRVSGNELEIGMSDWKSPFHHFGTKRGIPPRPLIGFEHDDQELTKELVEDYLRVILSRGK